MDEEFLEENNILEDEYEESMDNALDKWVEQYGTSYVVIGRDTPISYGSVANLVEIIEESYFDRDREPSPSDLNRYEPLGREAARAYNLVYSQLYCSFELGKKSEEMSQQFDEDEENYLIAGTGMTDGPDIVVSTDLDEIIRGSVSEHNYDITELDEKFCRKYDVSVTDTKEFFDYLFEEVVQYLYWLHDDEASGVRAVLCKPEDRETVLNQLRLTLPEKIKKLFNEDDED